MRGNADCRDSCPIKLENGEPYFRTLGDGSGEVWQEKTEVEPQSRWRTVQRDAMGKEPGSLAEMPTMPAVKFLGVVNVKHRCKPVAEHLIASPRISLASQKRFR